MASLNLEYSSKILESLSAMGVNTTDAQSLKSAFADGETMSKLKEDGLKKGIPVALFDMLSAGIAGKMISKPASSIVGKLMQGVAETGVQSALGAAGEASGQLVSEGKISNPNAILMEAIGELGPGSVEVAYGSIIESAKRNKTISKEDLVSVVAADNKDLVRSNIEAQVASGNITRDQANLVLNQLTSVETSIKKVPSDLSNGAKASTIELVEQKAILVDQSKNLDDAFKPEIEQKIKQIDEQILQITQNDKNATTIAQPQVIVQEQTTQPEADISNSVVNNEGQLISPELSIIESLSPDQIEVSEDATEFANQMTAAQSSLGKGGMSVSPYAQEDYDQIASEGGKFLRAAGNKILALLKPNGEMVSLVKDATVKTKGAAQAMISKMKDMGGLFMDNYDIYLTPIYEKAGYKVVARVPFNEQYAEAGWDAEDSPLKNKPDVVFMVRKDLAPDQAQTFQDYGDAQAFTQGLVDKAVGEGVAKLPTQITSINTALDAAIPNATKSLEKANIKFQLVDAATDTDSAKAARGNQGLFVAEDGTIIIDKSKLQDEVEAGLVVWHEASHPVMNIIRNTNKPLYNAVVRGINDAAKNNAGVAGALNWAQSQEQYDNADTQNDEAIVETIGRINSGLIDVSTLDTGLRQQIIDFVNSIAKFFGIDPILNDTDLAAFKKTVSEVADALKTGRDISEIVGQENVGRFDYTAMQARKYSSQVAKETEDRTVDGLIQPSMVLKGKVNKQDVDLYSGPSSIEDLKLVKPTMYVSRAEDFAKSDLVQGKVKMYPSTASIEQKLKWADNVYKKAKETVVSNLLFVYDSIPDNIRDISKLWYDGANIIAQELATKYNTTLEQASAVIATQSPQKPWYDNVHLAHFIMDFYAKNKDMEMTQEMYDYYKLKAQPSKINPKGYPKQIEYLPVLNKAIGKKFSELSTYDRSVMMRAEFDNKYERRAPLRIPTGVIVGRVTSMSSFSGYDTIAKGISILDNGSEQNISDNLGGAYKVRNFNNNIVKPREDGEVTIDTHAMAAAYLLPLGSSSPEVKFDEGTYAFFADAYRDAAKKRGVLAREMQSIVWEGVRSVFPASDKSDANKKIARDIWSNYKEGSLTLNSVQDKIKNNGKDLSITDWSKFSDRIFEEDGQSNYLEELSLAGRDRNTDGLRDGSIDSRGLPGMGRGSKQNGNNQASVGNRSEDNLKKGGEGKERKRALSSRFGDLDPETQAKIQDDATTYFQRPNKQTATAVNEFLDELDLIDAADYILGNPDIPEVSKVWMAAEIAKRLSPQIDAATDPATKEALTNKQSSIYNEFAKKATDLGQAVQAFIAFKKDPNAVEFFLPKMLEELKKKGAENITDIQKAEIATLLKEVSNAPEGLPKDKAIIKLSHYLGNILPMKPMSVLQALWYAKILSGVTTQATNFFANVFNTAFELPAVSLRIAIKNGNPMALLAGIKGFGSGVAKGAVTAADIFKSGVRSKEVDKYFAESPLEYFTWSKWLGKTGKVMDNIPPINFGAWKYVGRLLAATDALFATANQEAIANMLAYAEAAGTPAGNNFKKTNEILGNTKQNIMDAKAQARAEGFDPNSVQGRRRVIEIVSQKRGEKITSEADAIGKRITLNYDPEGWTKPLFDATVALQQKIPAIKIVIPFARIVANLTENALNYSPFGLAKAATGIKNPFSGLKSDRLTGDERADMFLKFAIGMGTLAFAATKVGDDDDDLFEITASGTPDVQKKYELQKGGWRPYTITFKDGTKISYKDWPIAGMLAGLGHIRDAKKYSYDDTNAMTLAAYGFFLNMYDKSLLSGLQDFFGLFDAKAGRGKYAPDSKGSERAQKYAAQQVKSVAISNLAQQTGRLYSELITGDPQRDARTFMEVIYKDLPIVNDGIRPIIDVFGDPVKYNTTERLKPIYTTESDEMIKWLNENKLFVGVPQRKNMYTADGEERPMTDDEFYEYRKLAGKGTKDMIKEFMEGIEYPDRQISEKMFDSAKDAAREIAYVTIIEKYGFK